MLACNEVEVVLIYPVSCKTLSVVDKVCVFCSLSVSHSGTVGHQELRSYWNVFRATGCENGRCQRPLHTFVYMVNQLQYDSVHGRFNGTIAMSEERSQAPVLATESAPITSFCHISDARRRSVSPYRTSMRLERSLLRTGQGVVRSTAELLRRSLSGTRHSSFFRERFIQHCRELHPRADDVGCSGNITGETTAMTHEEAEIPPPVRIVWNRGGPRPVFSGRARRVRPKWDKQAAVPQSTHRGAEVPLVCCPLNAVKVSWLPGLSASGVWCLALGVLGLLVPLAFGLVVWFCWRALPSGPVVPGPLLRAVCCLVLLSGLVVWPCLLVSSWPCSSFFRKRRRPRAPTQRPIVSKERRRPKDRSLSRYLPLRQLQYSMAVVLVGLACASASPYFLPVSFLLMLLWSSSQFWHFQRY